MAKNKMKSLQLNEKELDELSVVTPGDIVKAKQMWRDNVDEKYKDLLDAIEVELINDGNNK